MPSPNFIEVESVEEANAINSEEYTLVHFSEKRNKFIFKKRRGRQ
jgi:hypothetical protein